jgi:hypothetical protein
VTAHALPTDESTPSSTRTRAQVADMVDRRPTPPRVPHAYPDRVRCPCRSRPRWPRRQVRSRLPSRIALSRFRSPPPLQRAGTGNRKSIDYRAHAPINKRAHAHSSRARGRPIHRDPYQGAGPMGRIYKARRHVLLRRLRRSTPPTDPAIPPHDRPRRRQGAAPRSRTLDDRFGFARVRSPERRARLLHRDGLRE